MSYLIQQYKDELLGKQKKYMKLKSRREWLKKHTYVQVEKPPLRDLRVLAGEIKNLKEEIGKIKSSTCLAFQRHENAQWVEITCNCLIHPQLPSVEEYDFYEGLCFNCERTREEIVAIVFSNLTHRGKLN